MGIPLMHVLLLCDTEINSSARGPQIGYGILLYIYYKMQYIFSCEIAKKNVTLYFAILGQCNQLK